MIQLTFEIKKMIRTKTFFVLLLVTILCISGLFIRNVIQQDVIPAKKIEYFSKLASDVSYQNQGDRVELEKGSNAEIEGRLLVGSSLYSQLNQLNEAIEKNKWREELELEMSVYNIAIRYKELQGSFSANVKDMENTLSLNEELLKQGLAKEDFDLSIQTAIFMKKVVSLLLNPVGFIVLLLALGTMITREFEDHNIQLVYALPIARSRYIIVKFVSLFLAGILWLSTVFTFSYAWPTLFGKSMGNIFNYPLVTQTENFLEAGTYIREAVLYSLCFTAFSIAVVVFVGFMIRNTIVTYVVILLLFMGGFIVSTNGVNSVGNPFTYQQIDFVILALPSYFSLGLAVLIGSSILLLLFTIGSNRKRGI